MTTAPKAASDGRDMLPFVVEICRLHRATAELEACAAEARADLSGDPVGMIERHKRLAHAVFLNTRILIDVQGHLLADCRPLPFRHRQKVLGLAVTGFRCGQRVLRGGAEIHALIKVNRLIIADLNRAPGRAWPSPFATDGATPPIRGRDACRPRASIPTAASIRRERSRPVETHH